MPKPLTDLQRNALPAVFANFNTVSISSTAESVEQRSRPPAPETVPPDVSVCIEIAPPSPHPDPILGRTGLLKAPEHVPIYFYTLRSEAEVKPDIADSEGIKNTRVIFFIHGGGNVIGHPTLDVFVQYFVHLLRAVASHSGGATKCVLIAPSYRLATIPENTFPAALQDLVAAYDYVIGKGYNPSNIFIAGDSAGGNHAVVLTHLILEANKPCPSGVVAIAPASIQTNDSLSDEAKDIVKRHGIDLSVSEQMWSSYVGNTGAARTDPLVSGTFLPFTTDWPKMLILIGTSDSLIDASRLMAKRLGDIGKPVELVEYEERPHAWWILSMLFSEDIDDSAERIARFILD